MGLGRRGPLALVLAVGVLGLAACGQLGGSSGGLLPGALAGSLADQSDQVASQLEAGDACGASRTLATMRSGLEQAISAGDVPSALGDQIGSVIGRLDELVVCSPSPAPPTLTQTQTQTIAPPPTTTGPSAEEGSSGPGP
jgi:hypothetical protein